MGSLCRRCHGVSESVVYIRVMRYCCMFVQHRSSLWHCEFMVLTTTLRGKTMIYLPSMDVLWAVCNWKNTPYVRVKTDVGPSQDLNNRRRAAIQQGMDTEHMPPCCDKKVKNDPDCQCYVCLVDFRRHVEGTEKVNGRHIMSVVQIMYM